MRFEIPEGELAWFFDTSGGPGGQHANRNATRVELRFSIVDSDAFADDVRDRLVDALGAEVRIIEDGTRSQSTNRTKARRRLDRMLDEASKPPPPPRRPTKPTRASQLRRVDDKRRRGATKRLRQPPD